MSWQFLHKTAAIAGVDPRGFTLRELLWRSEAVAKLLDSQCAWMLYCLARMLGVKRPKLRHYSRFDTLDEAAERKSTGEWIEAQRGRLPEKMSNEDILAKWERDKCLVQQIKSGQAKLT